MTTTKRRPARKQAPIDQPQATPPDPAWIEPEPEAPEHVRALARKVRQHIGKQRHHFEAAANVPVMYGYNGLSHVVNGHAVKHIATRDELSEMSDQQIYDAVMRDATARPRQGYPIGGR
jgi:hypothetical protein